MHVDEIYYILGYSINVILWRGNLRLNWPILKKKIRTRSTITIN